jgi:hypothetical protein
VDETTHEQAGQQFSTVSEAAAPAFSQHPRVIDEG